MEDAYVLDCEVYRNYFLVAFKGLKTGKVITLEARGFDATLSEKEVERLIRIISTRETFGFNSNNYDLPIIAYTLCGNTCKSIKSVSDYIIDNSVPGWQTLKHFDLRLPKGIKHIDIKDVAPGVGVSLKLYGARLNSKKLQDLPYSPEVVLTNEEMDNVKLYCINDLDTTIDLYHNIEGRINLRREMSAKYNIDLMSKSDAQIAEAVIKKELSDMSYTPITKPSISHDTNFKCNLPSYIKFSTKVLNDVLDFIKGATFTLDNKLSIQLPNGMKGIEIKLGNTNYQMGVSGGLHSTEHAMVVLADSENYLIDMDVTSYYPNIILNSKIYPSHLGENFLSVYESKVNERIHAKRNNLSVVNESLKTVINGVFGKLGSKYSYFFSPDLLMTVTMTGRLSLLMLIEQLEVNGIRVVSANTDGVVSLVPSKLIADFQKICENWERVTGFNLEETRYKSLYARDVNHYFAVKENGEIKRKGIFSIGDIGKNPRGDISAIAVVDKLTKNISIAKTINDCNDIRKFIYATAVQGGAIWENNYLGKVVRWVYVNDGSPIYRKKGYDEVRYSGERWLKREIKVGTFKTIKHKVSDSDGCMPVMELDELPCNIDRGRYINKAFKILEEMGITRGMLKD